MMMFGRIQPLGLGLFLMLSLCIILPLHALQSYKRKQQLMPANSSWTRPSIHVAFQSEPRPKRAFGSVATSLNMAFANPPQQSSSDKNDVHHRFAFVPSDEDFLDASSMADNRNKLIQISSHIELPFSAEVAYEAYSDLPRQPSWSSWLESVVVWNNTATEKVESKWTSKILGIRYSWTAEAIRNDKPHTIQWRSVTGLRNEGIVKFYPLRGQGYDQGPTLMTLQMAFSTPKAVTALVKRSKRLSKFVEESMIAQSLQDFKDVVVKEHEQLEESASETKQSSTLL